MQKMTAWGKRVRGIIRQYYPDLSEETVVWMVQRYADMLLMQKSVPDMAKVFAEIAKNGPGEYVKLPWPINY